MTSDRMAERDALERLERVQPGAGAAEDDLLPGGPDAEGEDDDDGEDDDEVAGTTQQSSPDGTKTNPIAIKAKRIKLPPMPANLDNPVWEGGATLTLVSLNHPITNVSATLVLTLDSPHFDEDLMGEHAYTVGFHNGLLGEGGTVLSATTTVDEENRKTTKIKVRLPRYANEDHDQIKINIAPLIGGRGMIEHLMAAEGTWGLNFRNLGIEGVLRLFAMQQAFDLTTRAE